MSSPIRLIAVGALVVTVSVVLALTVHTHGSNGFTDASPLILTNTVVHKAAGPHDAPVRTIARGSWCWFGDPRAVHVGGRHGPTFIGWIGWHGQITVALYRPGRGVVRRHVIGKLAVDDHGSPSILVEPDKRLTVFWSGHGGPHMNYRTTRRPLDLRTWGPLHHVPSQLRGQWGYTYPNPVLLPAEHDNLYLFWRGTDWSQDFETRTSNGQWSLAHRLISEPGERPYVKVASNGRDTVALAFTDGHPRGFATSVYYAAYRAGAVWTAGGRRIAGIDGDPISPSQADLVYDERRTGIHAWVWDVAFGAGGRPVIVYATFPSRQRHVYWYATWSGSRWVSHRLTLGGPSISPRTIEWEYSGGITLDHSDPSVVYLSRKVGRWFQIERWVTRDGGYTWRYQTVVRTPGSSDVRPIVPHGSDGGAMGLLWLHGAYRGYRRYRTSIAYGR
jgi:hypothetical protein